MFVLALVSLIIASLHRMRSLLRPCGESDRFSRTLCFYRARVPAGAACGGYGPPPVREAAKSALRQASCKKTTDNQSQAWVVFRLLRELLLLRIRREASGGLEGAEAWP